MRGRHLGALNHVLLGLPRAAKIVNFTFASCSKILGFKNRSCEESEATGGVKESSLDVSGPKAQGLDCNSSLQSGGTTGNSISASFSACLGC